MPLFGVMTAEIERPWRCMVLSYPVLGKGLFEEGKLWMGLVHFVGTGNFWDRTIWNRGSLLGKGRYETEGHFGKGIFEKNYLMKSRVILGRHST